MRAIVIVSLIVFVLSAAGGYDFAAYLYRRRIQRRIDQLRAASRLLLETRRGLPEPGDADRQLAKSYERTAETLQTLL